MNPRLFVCVLGFVLVATGCSGPPPDPPTPQPTLTADDYAVYSAAIESLIGDHSGARGRLVIAAETVSLGAPIDSKSDMARAARSIAPGPAVDDLLARPAVVLDVGRVALPQGVTRVDERDWRAARRRSSALESLPPSEADVANSPIVAFSRVGFNTQRDEAVVYRSYGCGLTCGDGTIYSLVKGEKGWTIAHSRMVWIS